MSEKPPNIIEEMENVSSGVRRVVFMLAAVERSGTDTTGRYSALLDLADNLQADSWKLQQKISRYLKPPTPVRSQRGTGFSA